MSTKVDNLEKVYDIPGVGSCHNPAHLVYPAADIESYARTGPLQKYAPGHKRQNQTILTGADGIAIMRISGDGVWVNPDIPTNDAAAEVIKILDQHFKRSLI
jgi:hypothetical protein